MRESLVPTLALLLLVPTAHAESPSPRVGQASVVERKAEATRDQTIRTLALRDALFRNERLSTGAEAGTKLHVRLLDQTVITLGPASEVVLDDFAINPTAGTAEVSLKLSRGLLRFVGGQHADTGTRYRVRTPVATIGVRGTAFNVKVEDGGETTVQLTEGELSFENDEGLEVILDEPFEVSSIDDEDDLPSEPEVDESLAEEFDDLDLSEEELAEDLELAEEIEDEDIEAIEDEDPDEDGAELDEGESSDDPADGESEGSEARDAGDSPEAELADDDESDEGGDPDDGDPDGEDPDAGDSDDGDSDAGDSDAGDSDAGDSDAGDSDAGDSDAGDPDAGDSEAGDSEAGDSEAGNSGDEADDDDDEEDDFDDDE